MNPAQRTRTLALVRAGFEDGPALTVASTDGEIPQGRELSFANEYLMSGSLTEYAHALLSTNEVIFWP